MIKFFQTLFKRARAGAPPTKRFDETAFLSCGDSLVKRIVSGQLDFPSARGALQEFLDSSGYQPDTEQAGLIRDLSNDERLNLIIETNTRNAVPISSRPLILS